MKYLELKKISDEMQWLTQQAFVFERTEAIDWIRTQVLLYGISAKDITETSKPVCIKRSWKQNSDLNGNCFKAVTNVTRLKMSKSKTGRKPSDETRRRMTESHLKNGNLSVEGQPVRVNGVNYRSYSAAGKQFGVTCQCVKGRCLSNRSAFAHWVILNENIVMLKQA